MSRVTTGRFQEGGRLGVHKADFNDHVLGESEIYKHTASVINIAEIQGVAATNVQEALESVTDLITSAGSGFISIGLADGYAQGSYTVGSEGYLTLRDAFNGAFSDPRLENGGIILVLAGTYKTSATITVPSGITVIGEAGGTIIVGEMPDIPIFDIQGTSNRVTIGGNNGLGALPLDSSAKLEAVKFVNLTLMDNLDGYAAFGQTSMSTAPMVRVAINSNFTCEFVRFIGRITDNTSYQICTAHAVRTASGSSSGTHLKFYKCFFDGINVPVHFTPAGGKLDSFIMDGCRARVFSKGENEASENCFVALTECNATISNNEIHEGGVTSLEYGIVLNNVYNDGSSITLTGNHGYVSSRVSKLIVANSGVTQTYNAIFAGNSWGYSIGTGWFVVAGLDYVGENALQNIINISINLNETEVYLVGSTFYKVTTNGHPFLKLRGGNVNLAVSSGTDTGVSSNRRFDVNSAIGTTFKCNISDTAVFHTVVVNHDAFLANNNKILFVDNCKFIDCGLRFVEVQAGTNENDSSEARVSNCQFYQSGSYTSNYSLLMPSASITILENCKIRGIGYAGGIGESSTYDHNAVTPTIIIRDCEFLGERTTNAISGLSPIVGTNDYYFWINDNTAKILIDNCIFNPSRPSGSLLSSASYNKAIYLNGLDLKIENTKFSNNDDFFTVSGINYQLPMLFIEPQTSLSVDKCNFLNTSLALQVGGPTAFSQSPTGATITNCNFNTNSDYSTTSIDFDIDLNSIPANIPRIKIDGNSFYHNPGDGQSVPVRHTEATGSFYDTVAGVMVYANLFDVIFTNNTMYSLVETGNFTKISGVVINNLRSNTQSSQRVTKTIFTGNTVYVTSQYLAEEDLDPLAADCVSIISPLVQMHNNTLSMYLDTDLSDVQHRILTLDTSPAQNFSESLITNNIFTTKDTIGNTGLLNSEFISIKSGSGKGRISENIFTDLISDIVNGGDEEVDDDSGNNWLIYNNKNQVKTLLMTSGNGNFAVTDTAAATNVFVLAGFDAMGVSSRITGNSASSSAGTSVTFGYTDTTDTIRFDWLCQAMDTLPYGVTILSISVTYTLAVTLTNTRTLSVAITSLAGTDSSSITIASNSQSTLTKNSTLVHVNTPENRVKLALSAIMEDSNATNLIISSFNVTYKW